MYESARVCTVSVIARGQSWPQPGHPGVLGTCFSNAPIKHMKEPLAHMGVSIGSSAYRTVRGHALSTIYHAVSCMSACWVQSRCEVVCSAARVNTNGNHLQHGASPPFKEILQYSAHACLVGPADCGSRPYARQDTMHIHIWKVVGRMAGACARSRIAGKCCTDHPTGSRGRGASPHLHCPYTPDIATRCCPTN